MIRIDKAALDYLLECASQIGFLAASMDTNEAMGDAPEVTIRFVQKIGKTEQSYNLNPVPIESLASAFVGVTEDQAKEIADKGKTNLHVPADKMQTLDEGTDS